MRATTRGFISVGAVCQRSFSVWLESVVTSVVGLICLVKRKRALRGRNLSRDSQAEGAPRGRGPRWLAGGRFFVPLRTPEPCLRKSRGEAAPGARVKVSTHTCS